MLIDEIKNNWESDIIGHAQPVLTLKEMGYETWTIKFENCFGVAIPYKGDDINEYFSNTRIYSSFIRLNNGPSMRALLLVSESPKAIGAFSALCAEFVRPGNNGCIREEITASPISWWREWKELLGNKNIDDRVYDVLGELCVLNKLIDLGETPEWNGPGHSTYDIETEKRFAEVKSTIVRTKKEVTISSQYQLNPPGKPLDLFFCIFEPTVGSGYSINSILFQLESKGTNITEINKRLGSLGYEEGRSARNATFILHDLLRYKIDSNFPRITPSSFVGGVNPKGIISYTYTVDLSGLPCESINENSDKTLYK